MRPPPLSPSPSPSPRRLIGVASVLVDMTVDVPQLPPRGGDVLGIDAGTAPGGGVNALCAARRLGLPAVYAAPHGTGPMGDAVRAALAADRVEVLLPPDPRGDTGYCLALVEPSAERTFVTVAGIESHQRPVDLALVRPGMGDVVYASGYDLAYPGSGPVLAAWLPALPRPVDGGPWLALDPGPLAAEIAADRLGPVLARADLLSVSAAEAEALGGVQALSAHLTPGAVLVVRDGARGARALGATGPGTTGTTDTTTRFGTTAFGTTGPAGGHVPAATPPGPVVDSNGAGDVHLGALLAALAHGLAWRAALEVAAAAASVSLTLRGANSGPTTAELLAAHPRLGPVSDVI